MPDKKSKRAQAPSSADLGLPVVPQERADVERAKLQRRSFVPATHRFPRQVLPDPARIVVLDQGTTGASVGFALAAVLNYVRADADSKVVSARMLYEFARLYDEWPGTDYDGSSLAGGMTGLWLHGVCLEEEWPYSPSPPADKPWLQGKKNRPAAVMRVERNLDHLRAAVCEHKAVAVSGMIHEGWPRLEAGRIDSSASARKAIQGGHAWAVIGYTPQGFLVQNSWGLQWGGFSIDDRTFPGVALWSYEDAQANLTDAWVVSFAPDAYRTPLVGYAADTLGGKDLLAIRREVDAFSYVLASRTIQPPLALGLFGDWGSGKSFFMQEMQSKITRVTGLAEESSDANFCKRVVQIKFNAWHFLDTDLWASLVTEIFDRLFESLGGTSGKPEEKLPALTAELQSARGVYQQAKEQLNDAKQARATAENALKEAITKREQREVALATQLDDLGSLLREDASLQKTVDDLAQDLGAPELKASYEKFEAQAAELKTLGRRSSALWRSMLGSRWGWIRVATLIAALFSPVLAVIAIEYVRHRAQIAIADFHSFALQLSALIGGVATWLVALARHGNSLLSKIEDTHGKLEKIRERRRAEVVKEQQQAADMERAREEAARKALEEAEQRVLQLEHEVEALQPGKLIMRFIEERTRSSDYRSRLGIVSLIRRDFERLSELADPESKQSNAAAMPVERILLYIDDLDRCKPDRVIEVLEAIHLLLAFKLFMVVVAVDPRWLRHCLERHYPNLLDPRSGEVGMVGRVVPSRPATAQDYLEKIFQIPFSLQPIRDDGCRRMIHGLMDGHIAPEAPVPIGGTTEGEEMKLDAPPPPAETEQDTAERDAELDESRSTEEEADAATNDNAVERLLLRSWELDDMQRLAGLFKSPRAVKRFVNTYRFLRSGVPPHELADFEGTRERPGTCRAALILLAIIVNYAQVGSRLLRRLRDEHPGEKPVSWSKFLDRIRIQAEEPVSGTTRSSRSASVQSKSTTSRRDAAKAPVPQPPAQDWEEIEWRQLCDALIEMSRHDFDFEDIRDLQAWVPTVARYSFSLSATATMTA